MHLSDIDRLANCGIYIMYTTPDQRYGRFYVAKFSPNLGAWKHLHENGWWLSYGTTWHYIHGHRVKCPTFNTPSEALCFALGVEARLGNLVSVCPIFNDQGS